MPLLADIGQITRFLPPDLKPGTTKLGSQCSYSTTLHSKMSERLLTRNATSMSQLKQGVLRTLAPTVREKQLKRT